jgi:hypothetical protein
MSAMPVTTRDFESRRISLPVVPTKVNEIKVEETAEMLLHEELAKVRIQELEERIRAHRSRADARSARIARRWRRVSRWANERSRRHQR